MNIPISNSQVSETQVERLRLRLAELENVDAQLQEAEQQRRLYQHLVQHSLGLVCSHDLEGVLLSVNPAAAASLGYSPQDGLGRSLKEFIAPAFQPQFEVYLEHMRTHASDSGYMRLRSRNGEERIWMYRNAKYEEPGQPPIVLGHALDVTERVRAEKALRESEEKYRQLFEEAPVAYYELDRSGVLKRVNRALSELLGWSAADMVDRHVGEFVQSAEREQYSAAIGNPDTDSRRYVLSFICKDASVKRLRVSENSIRGASGRVVGMRCAMIGAEDRPAAPDQKDELSRTQAEAQQFAYVVSHDLQAPLRQVSSILKLLEESCVGRLEKESLDWLELARGGLDRMSTLTEDLLRYSVVANADPRPVQIVDSGAALHASLMNLRHDIQQTGAQVTHGDLPAIMADFEGTVQVFQNLISNGIKYSSPNPPQIHIDVKEQPGEWLFSVRDHGMGIDRRYWERIFEPFKRLHGKEYPGTGIGLSICQRILERNGGKIWLESELGKGSTFYFTVPR